MTRIGIDVGSTYTKYCIKEQEKITELFEEKTPIRQAEYFHQTPFVRHGVRNNGFLVVEPSH